MFNNSLSLSIFHCGWFVWECLACALIQLSDEVGMENWVDPVLFLLMSSFPQTANHKVYMFILVIPSRGLLWKCASISGQLGPMTFRSLWRQLNADWSLPVMRMRGMLGGCKQHYQGAKRSVFFMVLSVMLLSHLRVLIPCFLEPFCTKNRVFAWTWNSLQQSATAAFPGLLKKCFHRIAKILKQEDL